MKNVIPGIIINALIAGLVLTACETKEQKVQDAKQDVQNAKQELKDAKNELNTEYPSFKKDAEAKIAANDERIAELKAKVNKPGKAPLDDMRRRKIDDLEKRNADLRARLYGYEGVRSDWESFKRDFNHDMDNLSEAFKDFGNDLKK